MPPLLAGLDNATMLKRFMRTTVNWSTRPSAPEPVGNRILPASVDSSQVELSDDAAVPPNT